MVTPAFVVVGAWSIKDTVHYNVGLAAAMVHGELQRMRSDGVVDGC